jgi:hypothetical protein
MSAGRARFGAQTIAESEPHLALDSTRISTRHRSLPVAATRPNGSASIANPKKSKSAVTNGQRLHVESPGDSAWARRFRDVLSEIISDLSGPAGLSEGQRQLARRAATLCIMCEKLEGEAAAGKEIDVDTFGQMTDRLGRAFNRLGLRRQAREVAPDLQSYLADRYGVEPHAPPAEAGE